MNTPSLACKQARTVHLRVAPDCQGSQNPGWSWRDGNVVVVVCGQKPQCFHCLWGPPPMSSASPIKTNEQASLNPIVFFGSTALILILTAALILFPDGAGAILNRTQVWLSHSFGWYYMLAIGAYLFFVAWI